MLEEEQISRWKIFLRQFKSLLIFILFAASMISLLVGEWTDFMVINCIILINGFIGFWQELKSEASLAALKKLTESRCKVMRDGELSFICSSELVPGDYLVFHEGELVTADVRLTESAGLMVDEAAMTGESLPILKDHSLLLPENTLPFELKNMLLAGTTIVRGTGKGIVVKTGHKTYLATIAEKGVEASPDTPLTKALNFFTKRYVVLLMILFTSLGVVGLLQQRPILDLAYILLAALVSAVPEGLPIVLTLVMVIGALALSKKSALIRYLPAVETLGSSTVVASDKTGTITEGKLIIKDVSSPNLEKLRLIAALCNDAVEGAGDPLDVALSDWSENYEELRTKHPRKWGYAFDAKLMLMATVHTVNGHDELLVKGAYEALKKRAENPEEFEGAFQTFLERGLRVLAFGYGAWKQEDPSQWTLRIVGVIGFLDPPKKEVKEAVLQAQKAGIRVVMITGDHPLTAQAIAKEVAIWNDSHPVLTGHEITDLSDAQLLKILPTTSVFARILPEQKYRIVKLLQSCREIVAVTGDGVNDVPALKAADLGIAMGGGTEAAKAASKMVITDNNLAVIIDAIKNGRLIADNIRKVIYYLLSTSLQEIALIALAIFTNLPLPLMAIQILWINIVTDGVQDKMFPFAKAEGNIMERKPRKPEKQFFDTSQIIRIVSFGACMGLITFFLYTHLLTHMDPARASTIIFTSVVLAQWANGIQAQKEIEPFFKNIRLSFSINPLIFLGVGLGILLQCLAVYGLPSLFHATPFSLHDWTYPIGMFFLSFFIVELRKWIELTKR